MENTPTNPTPDPTGSPLPPKNPPPVPCETEGVVEEEVLEETDDAE